MKITNDIINALKEVISKYESQRAFASEIDINEDCISKYLNGRIKKIEHDNWLKLEPFLRPCLPVQNKITYNQQHAQGISHTINGDINNSAPLSDVKKAIYADPDLTKDQKRKILIEIEEMKINNTLKM
jgi:hypothetical protein